MEKEHVLPDQIAIDLKVDLKIAGNKNDIENDVTPEIQKKLADVLLFF